MALPPHTVAPSCPAAESGLWFHGLLRQARLWLSDGECAPARTADYTLSESPSPRPLAHYDHPAVEDYLSGYLKVNSRALERGLRRSGRYLPMIRRIFAAEGLPLELAYLPAVESNYNPRARSSVRASGMWQFMWATARKFGLELRWPWYDGRLDPEQSTRAAARLLTYLHDRYGTWELALAAYNAGEGRVNSAIRRARGKGGRADYWSLDLPPQTEAYVPAFFAMAKLYGRPERFGFGHVRMDTPRPTDRMEIEPPISLAEVAVRLKMPLPELVRLNPAWRRGYFPRGYRGRVPLKLPAGSAEKLRQSFATEEITSLPWLTHTVAKRETLSEIATIYGVRMAEILAVNPILDRHLIGVGQKLVIPLQPAALREAEGVRVSMHRETAPSRRTGG